MISSLSCGNAPDTPHSGGSEPRSHVFSRSSRVRLGKAPAAPHDGYSGESAGRRARQGQRWAPGGPPACVQHGSCCAGGALRRRRLTIEALANQLQGGEGGQGGQLFH